MLKASTRVDCIQQHNNVCLMQHKMRYMPLIKLGFPEVQFQSVKLAPRVCHFHYFFMICLRPTTKNASFSHTHIIDKRLDERCLANSVAPHEHNFCLLLTCIPTTSVSRLWQLTAISIAWPTSISKVRVGLTWIAITHFIDLLLIF